MRQQEKSQQQNKHDRRRNDPGFAPQSAGALRHGKSGHSRGFGIALHPLEIGQEFGGGLVAQLAIFLQHASAPFIFSGALAAPAVAAVRETLNILKREPERVARLRTNANFLREGLRSLGYDTGLSQTPVIPVMLHDDAKTALFARKLRDYGVLVSPVLFPAVAQGAARLRLCVTAAHTSENLAFALDVFEKMRSL